MPHDLASTLHTLAPLTVEEAAEIRSCFEPMQLPRGRFFLKEGQVSERIGYVQQGLVRYFVHKADDEATFEFTAEGDFIADYQSFNSRQSSIQNIEAIEDCILLTIGYEQVQHIFRHTKHGNLIGRLILEHRFDVMVSRLLSLYMHAPGQRYQHFISNYASLAQRIPQYHIASFVGVKPQSLSRMRKRWSQKIS